MTQTGSTGLISAAHGAAPLADEGIMGVLWGFGKGSGRAASGHAIGGRARTARAQAPPRVVLAEPKAMRRNEGSGGASSDPNLFQRVGAGLCGLLIKDGIG